MDEVLEVKRIMGVKSESSPYTHIAQAYAIGSDQGKGKPSPTPRVDCIIEGIECCNVLCDVGAHVSVMSFKVYVCAPDVQIRNGKRRRLWANIFASMDLRRTIPGGPSMVKPTV